MAKHRFSLYSLALFCLLMVTGVSATVPISFTALTKTTASVPSNLAITVEYTVKNITSTTQPFVFRGVTGVTSNAGTGLCGNSFSLAGQKSCKLQLVFTGSLMASKVDGGFKLCPSATATTCYTPSSTLLAHMTRVSPVTIVANPAGSNLITMSPSDIKTVTYNIKNNTAYRLALHWFMVGGIQPFFKQLTGQSGDCATSFALAGQANCNLRIQITGSLLPGSLPAMPIAACDPQNTTCYLPVQTQWLQLSLNAPSVFFASPAQAPIPTGNGYSITIGSPQGPFVQGDTYALSIQNNTIQATFQNPDVITAMLTPPSDPAKSYQPGPAPIQISQNGQPLGVAQFTFLNGGAGGMIFTPDPTSGSIKGGYKILVTSSQPFPSLNPIQLSLPAFGLNLNTQIIPPMQFSVDLSAANGVPIPLPILPGTYTFNVVQDGKVLGTVQFTFTQ